MGLVELGQPLVDGSQVLQPGQALGHGGVDGGGQAAWADKGAQGGQVLSVEGEGDLLLGRGRTVVPLYDYGRCERRRAAAPHQPPGAGRPRMPTPRPHLMADTVLRYSSLAPSLRASARSGGGMRSESARRPPPFDSSYANSLPAWSPARSHAAALRPQRSPAVAMSPSRSARAACCPIEMASAMSRRHRDGLGSPGEPVTSTSRSRRRSGGTNRRATASTPVGTNSTAQPRRRPGCEHVSTSDVAGPPCDPHLDLRPDRRPRLTGA
jgi:hypothetical protein